MSKKILLVLIAIIISSGLVISVPSISQASSSDAGLLAPAIIPGEYAIALEPVADGLTAPNWGTFAPGQLERLYVSDQAGQLWAIDLTDGSKTLFLDVSDRLVPLGIAGPGTFDERGLLGFAFHPDYPSNGHLYTWTSEPVDGLADFSTIPITATADHQAVLLEWEVSAPGNPDSVVITNTVRELLRVDEPQFNHNGGAINFGPDDMLYIALGDGGASDDQGTGHGTTGNGQDTQNVLGAILRINPEGTNSANGQYGIPADNPFVDDPTIVDEIYAFGFRNPFRFSFDSQTGELYVGDVGQNDIEEVNLVSAGGNYGWNIKEGSFCFDSNGSSPGFAYDNENCPGETPDMIDPLAEYNTSESLAENQDGRAVIGGFVYRGDRIPPLQGAYIFGDYSRFTESGINNDGRLFYIFPESASPDGLAIKEFSYTDRDKFGMSVLGFAQDAAGELYVLANDSGTPFEDTGVVLRIAPMRAEVAAVKDNTLYEHAEGSTSNGAGYHFFVGQTNTGSSRRGVLEFDIAERLPSGSTITSASLDLHMSRTTSGNQSIFLHRIENSWGEGISNANANEGSGAPATSGDATWLHRFYDDQNWSNPGGDFSTSPSAMALVGGVGFYTWESNPALVADVQGWADDPDRNFGWILVGSESQNRTAKRFDSKENPTESFRPVLSLEYLPKATTNHQIFIPMVHR